MTILDEITAYARIRVEEDKKLVPFSEIKEKALKLAESENISNFDGGRFEKALKKPGISFICEVKKASPSKGLISPDFPYLDIAKEYEKSCADAISCLTEPKWFLGSDGIFGEIRKNVTIPMLRKDFTVDEYQLYQAKLMGADCVLLICAVLETQRIREMLQICNSLHMDALVETHTEKEIESALEAGGRIIGVNNRNLKDFSVDFSKAASLRNMIPEECVYVAESGVSTVEDVRMLKNVGADAVLMGEVLMRSPDKAGLLAEMRNI